MNKTNFNTASKQDHETGIPFDCYVRQFSRKKQMGPFPRTTGQSLILERKKKQSLSVTLFTKKNMNSFFRKNKKRSNKNSILYTS